MQRLGSKGASAWSVLVGLLFALISGIGVIMASAHVEVAVPIVANPSGMFVAAVVGVAGALTGGWPLLVLVYVYRLPAISRQACVAGLFLGTVLIWEAEWFLRISTSRPGGGCYGIGFWYLGAPAVLLLILIAVSFAFSRQDAPHHEERARAAAWRAVGLFVPFVAAVFLPFVIGGGCQ